MKVYDVFHKQYNNDLCVCYEFNTEKEAMEVCKVCDQRGTRKDAFISDGEWYISELINEDVANILINNYQQHEIKEAAGQSWNNFILFKVDQQAYGDMRYYFNRSDKKFYKDYFDIGD